MGLGAINFDNINIGDIFRGFKDMVTGIGAMITGKTPLDQTKVLELQAKAAEIESILMQAQTRINEIEAANPSRFVSGWRPAVGWVCAIGLATQYLIFPIVSWFLPILGHPEIKLPAMDVADLYPLLFGMLGFGGMRTYEAIKGVKRVN